VGLPRSALAIGTGSLLIAIAALNLVPYFRDYNHDPNVDGVLGDTFLPAITEISRLDDRVYVLLFSERITYFYPARQFLAPRNSGEDRSAEFGRKGFDLTTDGARDTLFMFLGKYRDYATEVGSLYPGGQLIEGPDTPDGAAYRAYFLPAQPNKEPSQDQVSRDAQRRDDLRILTAALHAYKQAHRTYPSTNSNVQTACRFETLDQLCGLRPLGVTAFQDPAGEDYWYSSDGQSFTLYASLDSPPGVSETCQPRELARVPHLLCLHVAQ
jgi:hypothetical protein